MKKAIQELNGSWETGWAGLSLVFTETKRGADDLEKDLWNDNINVTAIHGDRSQNEREEWLWAFKSGWNPVLVATDVAARGLDIPNVNLVINYDMPKNIDDYVHRIGRTGRAGRTGTAVTLINKDVSHDVLKKLYWRLADSKQEIPEWFTEIWRANPSFKTGNSGGKAGAKQGARDARARDARNGNKYESYRQDEGFGAKNKGPVSTSTKAASGPRGAPAANDAWGASGADDAW